MASLIQHWTQRLLGADEAAPPASGRAAALSSPPDETHPQAGGFNFLDFQRRFAQLLAQRARIPVGRINVVTLTDLKNRLGDRWPRLEDQVHQAANRIINSHVSPRDIVAPFSPLEYLVVLSDLPAEAAQLKCATIALEIYRHFLGQEDVEDVSIRTAVSHDGNELVFDDVTMSSLKERVAADVLQDGHGGRVPSSFQLDGETLDWPGAPSFGADDGEEGAAGLAGAPEEAGFDPASVAFIYRPVWDVKREVMSTFLCLPCYMLANNDVIYRYDMLGEKRTDETCAWIDAVAAHEALVTLDELLRNKFNMFVGIALHFNTLASPRLRPRVLNLFAHVPKRMRRFLCIEIVGVPGGVPSGRMSQIVGYVKPLAHVLHARVDPDHRALDSLTNIGLHAVGLDIQKDSRPESAIIANLNGFAERAANQRLQAYCLGIPSTSLAIAAAAAGFRYISGVRVAADREAPENVLRYNWRDFYIHHNL